MLRVGVFLFTKSISKKLHKFINEMLQNNLQNLEEIQAEIDQLDVEEDRLELELKDVLTDVDTPSESEDEEEFGAFVEPDAILQAYKDQLLACVETPTDMCDFGVLYEDPEYKRKSRRKLKALRKEARITPLQDILTDPRFTANLERIREMYPVNGGREFLNELVALHCTQNPE
jgi:hypothetical protein